MRRRASLILLIASLLLLSSCEEEGYTEDILGFVEVPASPSYTMAVLDRNDTDMVLVLQFPDHVAAYSFDVTENGKPVRTVSYDGGVCTDDAESTRHVEGSVVTHDIDTCTFVVPAADPSAVAVTGDIYYWQAPVKDPADVSPLGVLHDQVMKVNAEADDLLLNCHVLQDETPVLFGDSWYVKTGAETRTDSESVSKVFRFRPLLDEPDAEAFSEKFQAYDEQTGAPAELPSFHVGTYTVRDEVVVTAVARPADVMDHISILYGSELRLFI